MADIRRALVINMLTRRIFIVLAAVGATANGLALQLDTVGGAQTFTVGLSADGNSPATHYWCSWVVDLSNHPDIEQTLQQAIQNGQAWEFDGETTSPDDALATLGLQRLTPVI